MKKIIFVSLLLFGLSACQKENTLDSEIRGAIESEIVLFDKNETIPEIEDLLHTSKILIFGEQHYVQEHHDFIVSQLPALSNAGYRIIFQESFHCFTWMLEDYLTGKIAELPSFILYFDEALIEGVKQFNRTADDSLKFKIIYMDMNHWTSNFLRCVEEIEKVIGVQDVFIPIKNIPPDSDTYKQNLLALKNKIKSDSTHYVDTWGPNWFTRIQEIIEGEVASYKYRISRSDEWREQVMFENIRKTIQKFPGTKYIVNTGSFHAQKQTYMGGNLDRLAKRLKRIEDQTRSIAFLGVRGKYKKKFDAPGNIDFDLISGADPDDMIRELDRLAGHHRSFLQLTDENFMNTEIKITYYPGTTIIAPIGEQFDAILSYPEISTFTSMDKYDWK